MKITRLMPRAAKPGAGATAAGRPAAGSPGFTLLETLVAMTILSIGLLGVAQMIPLSLAGVSQAGVRTNAVQAAQQRIDDLRAGGFASPGLEAGTYSEMQGKYTLDWMVTDSDPLPGSKRIVLTASWQTAKGTQTTTLRTFVTRGN